MTKQELYNNTFISEEDGKFLTIHIKDTPARDFETGEMMWGMKQEVIDECDTKEDAENALANYRQYQHQFVR